MSAVDDTPDPRSRLTRQRLVEAGRRLFAEEGYDRTTTAEIAKAARVSERTFFRHFASKSDLFMANWHEVADLFCTGIATPPFGAPLIDVARAGMLGFADGFARAFAVDVAPSMEHYLATLPVMPMLRVVVGLESALSTELAGRIGRSGEDLDVRVAANTSVGILRACSRRWGSGNREVPLGTLVTSELGAVAPLFDRLEP
jgi:AcrR family transcriptional regulator